MARRPPWYSFLYAIFGAQGTFWLWIVAVATLWFTWRDALLSMVNRYPEKRSVGEAASSRDFRRWVLAPGVRVRLEGRLLLREDAREFQGTEILIDRRDPSARFWRTTRAIADMDAGALDARFERTAASLSETALVGCRAGKKEARENLRTRRLLLETKRVEALPRSGNSLLLFLADVAPSSSAASMAPASTETGDYDQKVTEWRDAVRGCVAPTALQGLLEEAPSRLLARVAKDPGIELGTNALTIGRTPNDVELYVFCGAALVFLFLATGLWGVVSVNGQQGADVSTGVGPSSR